MKKRISKKSTDILGLLAKGITLEFRRSPRGYFRTIGKDRVVWAGFQRKTLLYAIRALLKNGFVAIDEDAEGYTKIALTDAGRGFSRKRKSVFSAMPDASLWDKK